MSWLSGWSKRIKLDIDYTNKIGASVTHFPVTIFLKSGNGDTEKVFDEVGANSKKIAVTKSDGTTELKVEIEQWDSTNKVGVLHTSLSGWEINEDTSIYLYYSSDHADNSNVGEIGSDAGKAVWDSNFKAVWHLKDDTTSTTKDSSSNGNNGTKKGANEPIEATGKVGKAQNCDGSNDYISCGNGSSLDFRNKNKITMEILVKLPSVPSDYHEPIIKPWSHGISIYPDGYWHCELNQAGGWFDTGVSVEAQKWLHLVLAYNGSTKKFYVNGKQKYSANQTGNIGNTSYNYNLRLGSGGTDGALHPFPGIIDEARISDIGRSAAWIKGTYNSTNDSLLTYGDQEVAGLPITIDNVQVKSITIDGQEVKGLTIDGETVF